MGINKSALLRWTATALLLCWASAVSSTEVSFQYASSPETKKAADKIAADLLNPSSVIQPADWAPGDDLSLAGPTPGMKRFSAAHREKLAQLDQLALMGHPGALLMKCYMGADGKAPRWIVQEGLAWCSILAEEAPASMSEVRAAARSAMEEFRKNNPDDKNHPDANMMKMLHQRLAQTQQQGLIQSVDPAVVYKEGMTPEKLVSFTLFHLGRDFTDYLNKRDVDRAIFNQQFAVEPGKVIKVGEYASFAAAYNFDNTLLRHPRLALQAP